MSGQRIKIPLLISLVALGLLAPREGYVRVEAQHGLAGITTFVPPENLTEVLGRELTGIGIEEAEQGPYLQLREQAKQYVDMKRGRIYGRKKLDWIAECHAHPGQNIFCDYAFRNRAEEVETSRAADAPGGDPDADPTDDQVESKVPAMAKAQVVQLINQWNAKSNLKKLNGVSEIRIASALRKFSDWNQLEGLSNRILNSYFCSSPALSYQMGQKAEDGFPDEKFRRIAIQLYQRTVKCSDSLFRRWNTTPDLASRARFRLSLLHLWEGACESAEPYLAVLSDEKNGDFVARALYWRATCAFKKGDEVFGTALRVRLIREYPLSYHGLLLRSHGLVEDQEISKILERKPEIIRFRSEIRPQLNLIVRAAEVLQTLPIKEYSEARRNSVDLLEGMIDKLEGVEPSFRVYIAVLMKRAGDNTGQFKVLSQVFREDPHMISRYTLGMFYPLKYFDEMSQQKKFLDPYFIAALIRQESGFNQKAHSPAGAIGLMQLLPGTGRLWARVSKTQLLDPSINIRVGVKYFRYLLARFRSDPELALAAYNSGPEHVDTWLRRYPLSQRVLFFDMIPFRETRDYVALISRNYYWYRNLYAHGADRATAAETEDDQEPTKPFTFEQFEKR